MFPVPGPISNTVSVPFNCAWGGERQSETQEQTATVRCPNNNACGEAANLGYDTIDDERIGEDVLTFGFTCDSIQSKGRIRSRAPRELDGGTIARDDRGADGNIIHSTGRHKKRAAQHDRQLFRGGWGQGWPLTELEAVILEAFFCALLATDGAVRHSGGYDGSNEAGD